MAPEILRNDMRCFNCMYSRSITPTSLECRYSPIFTTKDVADWCGGGLWRVWSKRFNCWIHYNYHEGADD